jgi:site-specific DNA-adenine methylase
MKPFFSYYGSKYRLCQQGFYPAPSLGNVVIEPFAGSATYSVYHEPKRAILIDKDPVIVGIWNYLINASEKQISSLPTMGDKHIYDFEDALSKLQPVEQNLIGFWTAKARPQPSKSLGNWFTTYYKEKSCRVWNEYVKDRIIKQLPKIKKWQAILGDYDIAYGQSLDFKNQTYFIDPPYSGIAGRKYKHNKINYPHLKRWIEGNKQSQIIACENQNLTYRWADFNKTHEALNMRGKSKELAWVQEYTGKQAVNAKTRLKFDYE